MKIHKIEAGAVYLKIWGSMLQRALTFFIFIIGSLFANLVDFNDEGNLSLKECPIFVSLGAFCEIALRLRDCGLREAAFPFDWLITKNHERFIELLDDDFRFFTTEEYFSQLEDLPNCVKNNYYEIYFTHDWPFPDNWSDPTRYAQQLHEIKTKYTRRIARFRQLKQYPGKVFFFRNLWFEEGPYVNSKHAQELKNGLDRYFPHLDFTLVIINYSDSNAPAIEGIQGVVEFKIRREFNLQDFQSMINSLYMATDVKGVEGVVELNVQAGMEAGI